MPSITVKHYQADGYTIPSLVDWLSISNGDNLKTFEYTVARPQISPLRFRIYYMGQRYKRTIAVFRFAAKGNMFVNARPGDTKHAWEGMTR